MSFDLAPGRRPARAEPASHRRDQTLTIGLINLMPDAAVAATEWQFRSLLQAASREGAIGSDLHLTSFAPARRRNEAGGAWSTPDHHQALDTLWDQHFDALIVTGTEPKAADLRDEPGWPLLAKLIDWATERSRSTIWSCLAAHAAVQHLDGIARRPLPSKMSGVFAAKRAADHPLTAGLPPRWLVPHSRNNDLDADLLMLRGYTILSRVEGPGAAIGADHFIKQAGNSLFVMMQGHPEYDGDCLLREYRRDMKRFAAGRRAMHPAVPENYFPPDIETAVRSLRAEAMQRPVADLLTRFASLVDGQRCAPPIDRWRAAAVRFYAGWLGHLAAASQHPGARQAVSSEPNFVR